MTASVANLTLKPGETRHITPRDTTGATVPVAKCTILPVAQGTVKPLVPTVATFTPDDTGFIFTGVEPGSGAATLQVTDGDIKVHSTAFTITVTSTVLGVGFTSP